MSTSVEVHAIDALEDLQTGLIRYADQAQATLAATARETQLTLDWLEERRQHWRGVAMRCREEERRALAAYQRCLNSGDRDHPPSCGREEQALNEARRRLVQAEAEERMATQARQAVQAEAEAYAQDAARLRTTLQTETVRSVEVLRTKVKVLRSYTSGGATAGGELTSALAFGAGLVIGAALRGPDHSSIPASEEAEGCAPRALDTRRARPLQELHPDIRDIPLILIDLSDSPVRDDADYHKVPKGELVAGFEKLAQVRRWISQGATEQELYEADQQARTGGMPEAQSHHNIYKVFCGDNAIALEKAGDRYRVLNGYHRLAVAEELGWTTIPARVVG